MLSRALVSLPPEPGFVSTRTVVRRLTEAAVSDRHHGRQKQLRVEAEQGGSLLEMNALTWPGILEGALLLVLSSCRSPCWRTQAESLSSLVFVRSRKEVAFSSRPQNLQYQLTRAFTLQLATFVRRSQKA